MNKRVLVAEISGKRGGGLKARPTENFNIKYDHLIISNNSENYETEWQIINVPEDYRQWYCQNEKISDKAYFAPMNRSYAIKYAKENGYDYLIQLDDNITVLGVGYQIEEDGITKKYLFQKATTTEICKNDLVNDIIDALITVLENTNAGMAGLNMAGAAVPDDHFLSERFCYSFFALKLSVCPDCFQGDFEDDIEYRLRLSKKNIPAVQICSLRYGKTAQGGTKDLSGCRKAYAEVGVKRGENMRRLYGDVYSAGLSKNGNKAASYKHDGTKYFKHKLKPVKVGVKIHDKQAIEDMMNYILEKYAEEKPDKYKFEIIENQKQG